MTGFQIQYTWHEVIQLSMILQLFRSAIAMH